MHQARARWLAVRLVAFDGCGRVGQPALNFLVARDGKIVVDADHVAVGIAELNDELVSVAGESMRRWAMDMQVPFPPFRSLGPVHSTLPLRVVSSAPAGVKARTASACRRVGKLL
jgi:hypothetical protein